MKKHLLRTGKENKSTILVKGRQAEVALTINVSYSEEFLCSDLDASKINDYMNLL